MTWKSLFWFSIDMLLCFLNSFHSWLVESTDTEWLDIEDPKPTFVSSCSSDAFFRNNQSPSWNCFISRGTNLLLLLLSLLLLVVVCVICTIKDCHSSHLLPPSRCFLVLFLIMILAHFIILSVSVLPTAHALKRSTMCPFQIWLTFMIVKRKTEKI